MHITPRPSQLMPTVRYRRAGLASLLAPYRGAIPAQRRGEDPRWP